MLKSLTANFRTANFRLLLLGLCTAAACEAVTARFSFAEVYLEVRQSFSEILAEAAGTAPRQPRDLMLNGRPLSFIPQTSERPVAVILDEYLAALSSRIRPATPKAMDGLLPGMMEQAVASADAMVAPKVARMGEDAATVTQFFDGDANAARDYLLDRMFSGSKARKPVPGVTVLLRRAQGAPTTDVLATRFDDAQHMLADFSKDADQSRLPLFLQPPPGAALLVDLGDRGANVLSRTVIASAGRSPEQWAAERRDMLELQGFQLAAPAGGHGAALTFGARRGAVEVDVAYVVSPRTGDTTEIIEIRQPSLGSPDPAGMDMEGSKT